MNTPFDPLKNFPDISALRSGLHALWSRLGCVARLDILAACQARMQLSLCAFCMGSAGQEQRLVRELGVRRFGGNLFWIVDSLPPVPMTEHRVSAPLA